MLDERDTPLMWRNETDFWNHIISVWKEKASSLAYWNAEAFQERITTKTRMKPKKTLSIDITVKDYNIKRQPIASDCNKTEKNWSFWFSLSWWLKLIKVVPIKMKE